MTIDELKSLKAYGQFHHATYRNIGKCWEGFYIYVKRDNGFNGFTLYGSFHKDDPNMEEAYQLVRNTGYSVGSYGKG